MKIKFFILTILAASAMGCSKELQDYVNVAAPRSVAAVQQEDGLPGVKFSAGHVVSAGTSVAMRATISPTEIQMKGNTISAKVGISRTQMR